MKKISPNSEPIPDLAIPRKPSPLPTGRWNYVAIVMGPFERQLVKKSDPHYRHGTTRSCAVCQRDDYPRNYLSLQRNVRCSSHPPALISKVTDAVIDQVVEWQNHPLDAIYPIVYLDWIVLKVRQDRRVINKAVFLSVLTLMVRKSCQVCGWPKMKGANLAECTDGTVKIAA